MNYSRVLLCLLLIAGMGPAVAQPKAPPPVESVIVTGTKSPEALQDFVGAVAAPTRLAGKFARWEVPVCPIVMGLNSKAVQFITRRMRAVRQGRGHGSTTTPNAGPISRSSSPPRRRNW